MFLKNNMNTASEDVLYINYVYKYMYIWQTLLIPALFEYFCTNSNLASLLCTTGGSCLVSPTKTNLWALKRGPREAGCRICEASSMIQTSNRRCVNTGWVIPSAVVATTLYRRVNDTKCTSVKCYDYHEYNVVYVL